MSRRQDRPDAIAWFLRNHPEITDGQIAKLLGTTKATIDQVRDRTHWNSANIKPVDPVTLGLVTQLELDAIVKKAAEKKAKDDAARASSTTAPPCARLGNRRAGSGRARSGGRLGRLSFRPSPRRRLDRLGELAA